MSGLIQNAIDQLDGMRAQASGSAGGCPKLQHSRLPTQTTKSGKGGPATTACSAGQAVPADNKAPQENGAASAAVQQAPAGKQKTPMGGVAKEGIGGKQQKKGKQGKCLDATAGCWSCTQGVHRSNAG